MVRRTSIHITDGIPVFYICWSLGCVAAETSKYQLGTTSDLNSVKLRHSYLLANLSYSNPAIHKVAMVGATVARRPREIWVGDAEFRQVSVRSAIKLCRLESTAVFPDLPQVSIWSR